MAISRKYGRTYHYPFSPGTTSDDRIAHTYWQDIQNISELIHTEKLDGENNCLNRYGVFARSHVTPTVSPWTAALRQKWAMTKHDLGDLDVFGENLFAIHSIQYERLEHHFYVFAVRENDVWLSWEETQFYAHLLDFPTVPVLAKGEPVTDPFGFKQQVLALVNQPSTFGSVDVHTGQPCTMEGVVSRDTAAYAVDDFAWHVFKYVRKGHVKTDQHWTRTWRRAPLAWERRSV